MLSHILFHHFEQLKLCVLAVSNIKSITPADCKHISNLISTKTRQNVSQTTIKRIYGFASSKFNPSLFTMDTLAKYCDYDGWDDFCQKNKNTTKTQNQGDITWQQLKQNAHKVAGYTLRVLKNKSGIPFNHTIKRDFVKDHFNAFLQGDYTATAFIAPAGYGKTIALTHWVDEKLMLSAAGETNDIILLLSGNALVSNFVNGLNLNDWMLSLLGYDGKEDIGALLDTENKEGDFFLIIDAFDDFLFKVGHFHVLLDEVVSIISLYKTSPWFKVVFTMRSATWTNYKHLILNAQSKWFPGFVSADKKPVNVPRFNIGDIQALCTKINPAANHQINIETAKALDNPLYFQFYYQSHADNFCVDKIGSANIHELVASYILNKIYLGHQATEKLMLIHGLIEHIDFSNKEYTVDKMKAFDLVKAYNPAYNDLISHGYLRELNTSNDQRFDNHIEFGNSYFLGHAVAQWLLKKNNYLFNEKLVTNIDQLLADTAHKVFLLKWCIIYAIKNGQYTELEHIAKASLPATEKAELLLFMGDLFDNEFPVMPCGINKLFAGNDHSNLFEYFFGVEFVSTEYEQSLKTLLRFELNTNRRISVYTSLSVIAIIQLDMEKLESYLSLLENLPPEDLESFPINPLHCIKMIHSYLIHGVLNKDALTALTRFYFNPDGFVSMSNNNSTNDVLLLLAGYSLAINDNPRKTLRFINAVIKAYLPPLHNNKGYDFILKLITIDLLFIVGKPKEAMQIYSETSYEFHANKNAYTPLMKALFYGLKLKVMGYSGQTRNAMQLIKPLLNLSEEAGYKLIKTGSLAFILANPQLLNGDTDSYKKVYFDFIKMIRESGFREKSFINNEQLQFAYELVNSRINV